MADEQTGEDESQALRLVQEMPDVIAKKDVKRILEIYDTYDPQFCTFEDADEFMRVDGEKFRSFVKGVSQLESSKIDRKDLRIEMITKDVAIVTGMDDWEAREKGKHISARSRFTIVLRKRGSWKIIHEHFTKLSDGKA